MNAVTIADLALKVVAIVAIASVVAVPLCLALGVFNVAWQRRRWMWGALIAVCIYVGSITTSYAVFYFAFLPAQRYAAEHAPGTLTELGQQAPNISVQTLDGAQVNLDDLRGRVVLLSFFATWCPPCQKEMPHLQAIWEEFKTSNRFAMLAVAREETAEVVQKFRDEREYSFPMAPDPVRAAFNTYASEEVPRNYVISPEGKILYQCMGYYPEELAAVRKLIARELAVTSPAGRGQGEGG